MTIFQRQYPQEMRIFENATLFVAHLGSQVPADLWCNYDFAIVAFDLTGSFKAFKSAWPLVSTVMSQESNHNVERLVVVGTKWDLIPSDPYSTAVMVYAHAREAESRHPGLKMFAVSSFTSTGYAELSGHLGELPTAACGVLIFTAAPVCKANILQGSRDNQALLPTLSGHLRRLGVWALDGLAAVLALPVPKNVNQPVRYHRFHSHRYEPHRSCAFSCL